MLKAKVYIERIVFPKGIQKTGDFTIFSGKIEKMITGKKPNINKYGNITFKGCIPKIKEGCEYTIVFEEALKDNYGESCKVLYITKDFNPANKEELLGFYNLITSPTIAKELIDIPDSYDWLLNKDRNKLLTIKGIGERSLDRILDTMDNLKDNTEALVKLKPYGLTENLINNICKAVGGSQGAIDLVLKNPYDLVGKIKGVGFLTVDEIAIKVGINPFSPIRLRKALMYILEKAGEEGKSYLNSQQVYEEFRKLVSVDFVKINELVGDLINEGQIIISQDGNLIALPYYYKLEEDIAKEFIRLSEAKTSINVNSKWLDIVKDIEDNQGWNYTEEQRAGIKTILDNNVTVVCGKAGTGKTTLVNAVFDILSDYDITMCCLSAKASQRLREVTGQNSSTIHKLLGLGSEEEISQLYTDVVVVDEASMPNGFIFLKLLSAIKNGAKVIILGDDGQLTSIGCCAVFSDLLQSKRIPIVNLTQIHRQARKSAIITKSLAIRNQERIYEKGFRGHKTLGELQDLDLFVYEQEELLNLVKKQFSTQLQSTNNILEVQVVSILKNRGMLCVANINKELQKMYLPNPSEKFFVGVDKTKIHIGDKVINTKNNYKTRTTDDKQIGVWNGSIGIVKEINNDTVIVDFQGLDEIVLEKQDLSAINLAYAITVHSSQGSQWERVIFAFDMSAYILLNVEIVYTGMTRASKHCSLIVEPKAMEKARRTVEQNNKQTFLKLFLQ